MPVNLSFSPSVKVSPIVNVPVSCRPTMSPGYAKSITDFFSAMKAVGDENFICFPLRTCS